MASSRKYPPVETLERIKQWCDRRERAHSEVRRKLSSWGVYGDESEGIIAELISSDFLNEERYARAFARGKSRIKGWGRRKIEQQLKSKGVSSYSINMAAEEIDDHEYIEGLKRLIRKKAPTIKAKSKFEKSQKMLRFLAGRGFTMAEVRTAMEEVGFTDF